MKKVVIIFVVLFIILLLSFLGYKYYQQYRIDHAVKIVKLKKDEIEVFEEVTLSDLIEKINGKLIKDIKIDTSVIGKKKISFKYINDDGIKVLYSININIVDKTPPLIKKLTSYTVEVGDTDFYKNFFCGDNYDDRPVCSIEGEYDINTPGVYDVIFQGKDSSNNISTSDFRLNVIEKREGSTSKKKEKEERYTLYSDIVSKYKTKDTKIGIDVSHFQGDIDFEKVKESGVEFAYIRVGRGGGVGKEPVLDNKFKRNIEGFNKVGIPVGVYFYSYAVSSKEAIKDATWVLKQIKKYKVDLEVAYDFEDWADYREYNLSFYHLTEIANSFNKIIEKKGYTGMLYSSKYYLENIWFKTNYPIWLAHYTDKTDYEGSYKVWQICEDGKIDGISNLVDIDIRY